MTDLSLLVVNGPTTLLGNLNFGENGKFGSALYGDFRGKEVGDWRFTAGNSTQKIVFQNSLNEALLTIDTETGQIIFEGSVAQGTETIIATSTLTTDDGRYIFCDATSAGFTITLPTAATSAGLEYSFVRTDATANVVTIDGAGAETINGAANTTLTAQYQTVTVACNGTTWYRLGSATDLTVITADVADLTTLSGVASNATSLGTFTGSTIADSSTVKTALQSLETSLESAVAINTSQATNITNLTTLSGVASNATSLGTFTGSTIADNQTNKQALQALETSLEAAIAVNTTQTTNINTVQTNATNLITLSGVATNATNLGTFTGTTIADSSTVKTALQSLETAVEAAGGTPGVGSTITSNTTLTTGSVQYQPCSSASGNITITLPSAASMTGREFTFLRTNTSANTITIDANAAELIDLATTSILRFINERLTIWCDGTKWIKKDHYAEGTFSPVMEGSTTPGSHSYITQYGYFSRDKNLIRFIISLRFSSIDTGWAGNIQINGLPVAPLNSVSAAFNTFSVAAFNTVSNNGLHLIAYTQSGDTIVQIREVTTPGALSPIATTNASGTAFFSVEGFYQVAN